MMAKMLIYIGLGFIGLGLIFYLFAKMGLAIGKLPGDFSFQKGKMFWSFPLGSSLLISILLTLLINGVLWLFRK